jgi:hypothetical protein
MEHPMTYDQLKMRTSAEAGGALTAAAAVNIDTDGPGGASGERATTTPLNHAQAQLVEALTMFDQLGMGGSPEAYLRKKPKPLNKSEREIAALAAAAVLGAAEAVQRIARDKLAAATIGMGDLVELMINAKIIQSLMLEVVRTLLRSITRAESPAAVAALVFQAKYLAGITSEPDCVVPQDHRDRNFPRLPSMQRRRNTVDPNGGAP